jgi:2-desacetyl-2-hydroxyethyl bacteriochlorophyllide A dehydrogenase
VPEVVSFTAPGKVSLVPCESMPLTPGSVRVHTWYSGISAGTELTAYRGSNPYLTRNWDPVRRLFVEGDPTFSYPVEGWGYSEVGEVVEVAGGASGGASAGASDGASDHPGLAVGDVVHGIWGHRSEAVLPAAAVAWRTWSAAEAVSGTFARVGSIALNAVLAADVRVGDKVAVFGQGVIGLLATRLAVIAGAEVVAVDMLPRRLEVARVMGASEVVPADAPGGAGAVIRDWSKGGVDAAIEISGSDRALHEAVRSVVVEGVVAASGFYQGGAAGLRLGEEFHHNRVRIVASQISGTPVALGPRWDQPRLVRTVMDQVRAGRLDVRSLVTDVVEAGDVAAIFERLDRGDPDVLQSVLRFDAAPAPV